MVGIEANAGSERCITLVLILDFLSLHAMNKPLKQRTRISIPSSLTLYYEQKYDNWKSLAIEGIATRGFLWT